MIQLPSNYEPVQNLLAMFTGTPDQLEFLTSIVQQHGANPQDFYARNPRMEAGWTELSSLPAFQQQDWPRIAHPYVFAQLLVDLCEKVGAPVPDNLYVGVDGAWQPLSYIQPMFKPAAPVIPVAAPVPAPAPAPDPYPQPVPVAATPPAPQTLDLQPTTIEGEFSVEPAPGAPVMVQTPVMGATVTMPAATAAQIEAARNTPREPLAAPAADVGLSGGTPHAAPPPAAAQELPPVEGAGQYGLPQPHMTASKGASPFDKDPGGEPPKTVQRQIRDMYDMMPRMFAMPAGDVVGKGTGSAQRQRVYLAAVSLLKQALASVPDANCPVGYLMWHLDHLRYNASTSAAGPTLLAFEKWMLQAGDHE